MLVGVNDRVLDQLEKTDLASKIGRENIFAARPRFGDSLFSAINNGQAWLEKLRDEQCAGVCWCCLNCLVRNTHRI